jgi:hypothetical protein
MNKDVDGLNKNPNFRELDTIRACWHGQTNLEQCLVNVFHFVAFWQMVAKRFHVNSNGFFKHFWELNGGT